MAKKEPVKDELVRLELLSISKLCELWAGSEYNPDKRKKWKAKIKKFREAVYAGMGRGGLEDIPFEFLADDYDIIHRAVKYVEEKGMKEDILKKDIKDWLRNIKISYCIKTKHGQTTINRPFPCPTLKLNVVAKRLTDKKDKVEKRIKNIKSKIPSVIAEEIVGSRLPSINGPVESETVRDACKRRKKNIGRKNRKSMKRLLFRERLLMSIFFDLNSDLENNKSLIWQAKILDILHGPVKIPPIALYYMIKVSNYSKENIFQGEYDFREVEKLCNAVCPNKTDGPFTQLLADSKHPPT